MKDPVVEMPAPVMPYLKPAAITRSTVATLSSVDARLYMPLSLLHLPRRLEDTSEESTGSQTGIKKGVWGEIKV
jgi:hypothetical protein